jgi:flagellum-specific peptidoglycan hydrolase FlgJ
MTRDEFVTQAKRAAVASAAESGFPAGITVAQAALESNWGESGLSKTAQNYFGIKAHGKLASITMRTNENDGDKVHICAQKFACYATMEDCFRDRDDVILRVNVYEGAREAKRDPAAFIKAVGRHWATDPHYAEKVLRIYEEWNLAELDAVRAGAGPVEAPAETSEAM